MKQKRFLAVLLLAILLLATTACQTTTTQTSTASPTQATSTTAGSAETTPGTEPEQTETPFEVVYPIITDGSVTLQYWTELNGSASKFISNLDESPAYQAMQERTGVDIEYLHPVTGQVKEQFNLLIVSGDLPDIISNANNYKGGVYQGMADGYFLDLTDYLPTYAPDYYALMQENEEFYREVSDDNGSICMFAAYKLQGDPPFTRLILRMDQLEKLGKEIPETIADWDDLFAAMYADGITPFMMNANGYHVQFAGAFDSPCNGFYKDETGKIIFGQMEPEFKDYLTKMNEWYEAGYISKDFTSVTTAQTQTMFDSGTLGCLTGAIVANYNRCAAQGIEVTSAPYPRMTEGQQLHHETTNIWPAITTGTQMAVVSTQCEYPEIAIQFLNYLYTDEGAELANWGVEGINYDVIDGQNVYKDLMFDPDHYGTEAASYIYKMHFAPKYVEFDTVCHANLLASPESTAARFKWADDPNVDSDYALPPFQFTPEETSANAKVMTEINTYVDEMVLKFITGAESLDNFDSYVQTIESMGIAEALQIREDAYARYQAKTLN